MIELRHRVLRAVFHVVAMAAASVAQAHKLYVLASGNAIATVDEARPSAITAAVAVSGVTAGQSLVAIDVRPMNNRLYGLATNGAGGVELYAIDVYAGAAFAKSLGSPGQLVTTSGTALSVTGTSFGIDFNPMTDRLRVITNSGMNFRMNPNTGAFVDSDNTLANGTNPDGIATGGSTTFDDVAYSNARTDAAGTTAYAIDSVTQKLFVMNPPNDGTLTLGATIRLSGNTLNFSNDTGLDIALDGPNTPNQAASGQLYAALTVSGVAGLYRINPADGAATSLGNLGGLAVKDVAVVDTPSSTVALEASGMQIRRFLTRTPATSTTAFVSGLAVSERLVGITLRAATGQYLALGVNPGADTATLYRLDPQLAELTKIGASISQIAFTSDGSAVVDLPDGTYGVSYNAAVDRVRVVASNGVNFRCNPDNGTPTDGNLATGSSIGGVNPDGFLNGASMSANGAAYTGRIYAGAASTVPTTLYTLDAAAHRLAIQNPPNAGTQTLASTVRLAGAPLLFAATTGFDVPPEFVGSDNNLPVIGFGYAALTVSGATHLYSLQLNSAATYDVGTIGAGTTAIVGVVVGREDEMIFRNGVE